MPSVDVHVVVGASLSGLRAAQSMRAAGFEGRIVLVGEEPHLPYDRPPLSKEVLAGSAEHADARLVSDDDLNSASIELRSGVRAVGLRMDTCAVELDTGEEIRADKVLLCTGSRARGLPVGGSGVGAVRYLRTVDDALALRSELGPEVPLVVVGAGLIGCEVAATARAAGCAVTLVEMGSGPMTRVVGSGPVAAAWSRLLAGRGVDLRMGTRLEAVESDGASLRVITDTGHIEAAVVVAGVGSEPADELATGAGIVVGDGILVDGHCATSAPGVYAAGDVANQPSRVLGGRVRVEHWQNAQAQGAAAGRSMVSPTVPFDEVPWCYSDQFGHNLQVAGFPRSDDRVIVRGDPQSMSFSAWHLRDGVLRATIGVDRQRDVRTGMRLIGRDARPDPAVLADEDTDLKELLRP